MRVIRHGVEMTINASDFDPKTDRKFDDIGNSSAKTLRVPADSDTTEGTKPKPKPKATKRVTKRKTKKTR
jgi:hypothetical protein